MLDKALSGLFTDLDERGMLDDTLVLCIGEFGRSPQLGLSTSGNNNSADGRDHWPYCYTGVIGGAGINAAMCSANPTRPAGAGCGSHSSHRTAGHHLPRVRHSSEYDRVQPPQPTARAGQGGGPNQAVWLKKIRKPIQARPPPGFFNGFSVGCNRPHLIFRSQFETTARANCPTQPDNLLPRCLMFQFRGVYAVRRWPIPHRSPAAPPNSYSDPH